MQSTTELDALGRIVRAIEVYSCQTTDNQDPTRDELLHTYLKQQLSAQDWALWQDLQFDALMSRISNQDELPDTGLPDQTFHFLLSQYKQKGFELAQRWEMAQFGKLPNVA
jgi:hypothetical protein